MYFSKPIYVNFISVFVLVLTHTGSDCEESLIGINKSTVMRQKLTEVAGSDRFRINNELDNKYQPRDPDTVVKDALHLVGEMLPYSLTTSNCEHFVTGLRYGKQESLQVGELWLSYHFEHFDKQIYAIIHSHPRKG